MKLEVLQKLKKGIRAVDLCKEYNLKASTLSTRKCQKDKLEDMAQSGKVLDCKQNHESFLPQGERAVCVWFTEMRSRQHVPPISKQLLIEKAT